MLLAIPLGMLAAVRQDTWVDYVIRVVSIGGLAIPSFWVGILVILFLVIYFGWGPPLEFTPPVGRPVGELPADGLAGGHRRLSLRRGHHPHDALHACSRCCARTTSAPRGPRGCAERAVVIRHALKNAMLPVITLIGTEFAFLIGGLVVTETVFTLNGVGRFVVDAVAHRDYPVVQALVFLIAFGFVVVNLLIDLTYAWFDPRIRYR